MVTQGNTTESGDLATQSESYAVRGNPRGRVGECYMVATPAKNPARIHPRTHVRSF